MLDPNFMMAATKRAADKARQIFGTDQFDIATVNLRSKVSADVSADTGNPQRYDWFAESSDFETLNPSFQLVRNRASEQGVLHTIIGVGLEILNTPEGGVADAASQQIAGVVGDGYTDLYIGATHLAHLNNGAIGWGGARRETREGTVDIIGGVQQAELHALAGLIHIAPGETFKPTTYIDGGRWAGLSMSTDFGMALTCLDVVCFL